MVETAIIGVEEEPENMGGFCIKMVLLLVEIVPLIKSNT